MTTDGAPPSLADFLAARLNEDEATAVTASHAHGMAHDHWAWSSVDFNSSECAAHGDRWAPRRVLAEVAAKRAVVGTYLQMRDEANRLLYANADQGLISVARSMYAGVELSMQCLAMAYADHPDFDAAWAVPVPA